MRMMSDAVTSTPAKMRCSTQSKPLSLSERAQPGSPSTCDSPRRARSSRLPGSTGMPKWSMAPPASTTAAGTTSRRSTMADAPAIRMTSQPRLCSWPTASATSVRLWAQRTSAASEPSSRESRVATAPVVESRTLSRIPGSRVWIKPTVRACSGARHSIGPLSSAISTQRSTTARDAAKGITLTVATIWPASTRAWGATVPSVMASSRRLSRSTRASSITARPCASAKMLQRPVKASPRVSPGPQTARATVSAASSSPTSSGSRRAPETFSIFASSSTWISSAESTRPFLKARPGRRTL